MTYVTRNERETEELAGRLAQTAVPGGFFCLSGELGAGKTVFARGFARGLGVARDVTSPTFCILNEYDEGRLPLYHFDAYRLASEAEMEDVCYPDYFYGGGVCLVEWAENIRGLIPENARWVRIVTLPDGSREITIDEDGGA